MGVTAGKRRYCTNDDKIQGKGHKLVSYLLPSSDLCNTKNNKKEVRTLRIRRESTHGPGEQDDNVKNTML